MNLNLRGEQFRQKIRDSRSEFLEAYDLSSILFEMVYCI